MKHSNSERLHCPLRELRTHLFAFERLTSMFFVDGIHEHHSRWTMTTIYLKKFYDRSGLEGIFCQNIFLLVVVCYILACKYLEDEIPDNHVFAHAFALSRDHKCNAFAQEEVAMVIVRVLNESELAVLQVLEFNMYVDPSVYEEYDALFRRHDNVLRLPFPTIAELPDTQSKPNVVEKTEGDIRIYLCGYDDEPQSSDDMQCDLDATAHSLLCFETIHAEYS